MPDYTYDTLPRTFMVSGQQVAVQWHHVINTATFGPSRFLNALEAEGLWSQQSIARNLIPLAANDASAQIMGTALHSGGHSGYNAFVKNIVAAFDIKYGELVDAGLDTTQFLENGVKQ